MALKTRLAAVSDEARPGGVSADPYTSPPHVTIAYANRDSNPERIVLALPEIHRLRTILTSVTLAAVARRDRHYEWDVRAEIPLLAESEGIQGP
jgi:hypothetical protein